MNPLNLPAGPGRHARMLAFAYRLAAAAIVGAILLLAWSTLAVAGSYYGCFVDAPQRALPVQLIGSASTLENCVAAATAYGYPVVGLQNGGECWAGNVIYPTDYARVADSECETKCAANPSEYCGGVWRNRVYWTGSNHANYEGCYTDNASRALPARLIVSDATWNTCFAEATAQGYAWYGLQNYGECWAGDLRGVDRGAEATRDWQCNLPCNASPGQICGGVWRNSLFYTYNPGLRPTIADAASPPRYMRWLNETAYLVVTSNRSNVPLPSIGAKETTKATSLGTCPLGSVSCRLPVKYSGSRDARYAAWATVNDPTRSPALHMAGQSEELWITWSDEVGVSLNVSATTLPLNGTLYVSASATRDVGPSPYYIDTYDAGRREQLFSRPWGTTFSTQVAKRATGTHEYVAFVAGDGDSWPPPTVKAKSASQWVTWSDLGITVDLQASSNTTFVATTNIDIGPTKYYIQLFDSTTGTRLAWCGRGTTCQADRVSVPCSDAVIAFVSDNSTVFLPSDIVANSYTLNGTGNCPN